MKRTAYCLLAAALALGFNACEGHSSTDLPEHYQHKMDDAHGDEAHDKADGHKAEKEDGAPAKPAEHAPADKPAGH